jgi:hypothetical protein
LTTSIWKTNKKYLWAYREQGQLTLVEHRKRFYLLSDEIQPLSASELAGALQEADLLYKPVGWSVVVGLWVSSDWQVRPVKNDEGAVTGWKVYSREAKQMSKQVFDRPDQARKWCEVRMDRVGLNLRGPKPKDGAALEKRLGELKWNKEKEEGTEEGKVEGNE